MKWQPKTAEQIDQENLCAEGKTPFTVLEAADTTSKSGKDMIKLKLNLHGADGRDYHCYDYISPAFFEHKFRHFFFSVGKGREYETGGMDAHKLVNLTGYADVGQEGPSGSYGPKNVIQDYIVADAKPTVAPDGAVPAQEPEEDDVPF